MPEVLDNPKHYNITKDNAQYLAMLSAEARRKGKETRRALMAKAREAIAFTDAIPEYVQDRLLRVRVQLDRIDEMILKEKDPSKLDRLASAQAKLAQQERELAGRPLPGSLRPTNKPAKRSTALPDGGFQADGQ